MSTVITSIVLSNSQNRRLGFIFITTPHWISLQILWILTLQWVLYLCSLFIFIWFRPISLLPWMITEACLLLSMTPSLLLLNQPSHSCHDFLSSSQVRWRYLLQPPPNKWCPSALGGHSRPSLLSCPSRCLINIRERHWTGLPLTFGSLRAL